MRIAVGSDHRGVHAKARVVQWLTDHGHEISDEGTQSAESVDYPDFAGAVSRKVSDGTVDRPTATDCIEMRLKNSSWFLPMKNRESTFTWRDGRGVGNLPISTTTATRIFTSPAGTLPHHRKWLSKMTYEVLIGAVRFALTKN